MVPEHLPDNHFGKTEVMVSGGDSSPTRLVSLLRDGLHSAESSRAYRSRSWHTTDGSGSSIDQETPMDSLRTS
jgi:hypothetical protein